MRWDSFTALLIGVCIGAGITLAAGIMVLTTQPSRESQPLVSTTAELAKCREQRAMLGDLFNACFEAYLACPKPPEEMEITY